jgi:alpha-L-rhamnosidase
MYFAYSTSLMAEIATILGKERDAAQYSDLFKKIKQAYIAKFIDANDVIEGNTQSSYTLSLAFDLVEKNKRAITFDKLLRQIAARDFHISTGFLGVKHFFEILSQYGRSDVAYRVLKQQTYPGWMYNISKGATTIWESWDTWKPGEGWQDFSLNHFNFGAVGEWMYSNVAGIQPAAPGFKKIRIQPQIDSTLRFAAASYHSMQGKIYSEWKIEKNSVLFQVEIPANTTAVIVLPVRRGQKYLLKEGNTHISVTPKYLKGENFMEQNGWRTALSCQPASGRYTYQIYYQQ